MLGSESDCGARDVCSCGKMKQERQEDYQLLLPGSGCKL